MFTSLLSQDFLKPPTLEFGPINRPRLFVRHFVRSSVSPSVRPCVDIWLFLQNGSKDLYKFLHECRGLKGTTFEPDGFS